MNQPYDPNNPAGLPPQPTGSAYGQQYPPQQYSSQQYPPPKKRSKLPIIATAVAVLVVAAAVTIFFVVRDDGTEAGGGGGSSTSSSAPQEATASDAENVAQAVMEAIDTEDEDALDKLTRGGGLDTINELMTSAPGIVLSDGDYYQDTETAAVNAGHVAVVYWEVDLGELSGSSSSETAVLAGMMYAEDGSDDGYQVCDAEFMYEESSGLLTSVDEFANNYDDACEVDTGGSSQSSD